jgi:DNA-binding FrmR family transcriptional regulator
MIEGERQSGVVAVLTEARLQRVQRALAPAQSHSAGLRSVAYGVESSGGVRETTADERAIDAGAVGRGREAWQRLAMIAGQPRTVLEWLTDYAHCGDVAALADLVAGAMSPAELVVARGVAEAQHATAAKAAAHASTALAAAKRILGASRAPEAIAGHLAARTAAEAAATRLHSAEAAVTAAHADLRAWGVAALLAGVEAWEHTAADRRAA